MESVVEGVVHPVALASTPLVAAGPGSLKVSVPASMTLSASGSGVLGEGEARYDLDGVSGSGRPGPQ